MNHVHGIRLQFSRMIFRACAFSILRATCLWVNVNSATNTTVMRNFQEKNYGILKFFSERLDSLIKQQFGGKWTRLAQKANIPLGTFDRYVKGTGKPSFDQIIRICEATGVQSDWLLMGKEETAQVEPAALYVREGVIDIAPYLNHKGEESGDGKEGNEPVNILLTANSSAFLIHSIEADPADLSIRFVSSVVTH